MLKFACKDAGVDCDYVATGNSVEEVKQAAFAHAQVVRQVSPLKQPRKENVRCQPKKTWRS